MATQLWKQNAMRRLMHYLNARHPISDANVRRKLFDGDFQKGWEAANSAKSLQSAESKTISVLRTKST
ncbi:hypothetical protein [Methylomicrobium sp. Wu6]|uniref:hypothetical protein n=1 Tax=Methylomicrobium sp. Wu6 TaxID=3107928 RepID=UPI002DD61C3D|nr:hypothetical protein [Methylomicrobium sp. Wu6]MEC4747729.1 hypothetical protein [Methylomicrobium sp. Wu6]